MAKKKPSKKVKRKLVKKASPKHQNKLKVTGTLEDALKISLPKSII
jgi:hypothetical protein